MDIKELQKIMQENGVVGAGGAGFPTYMKLTDKADTLSLIHILHRTLRTGSRSAMMLHTEQLYL